MSLIKCDECGNKVSDKSLFCPKCGFPTHLNKEYVGENRDEQLAQLKAVIDPEIPEKADETAPVVEEEKTVIEEPITVEEPVVEEESNEETTNNHNDRAKVWLFLIVSALVLGVMVYFYFTGHLASDDSDFDDSDSVYEQVITPPSEPQNLDSADLTTPVTPPAVATQAPVTPAPAVATTPEPPREVEVRSLREQSAPPTHNPNPATPAVADPTPASEE